MSPTTSWVLAHDVIGFVSSLFICVRHNIRGPLRGCPRQGYGPLHRFSLARRCPRGYASFARRRRPRNGFPCTGDILVRLGRNGRARGIDVRLCCRAVTWAVDASLLARMGMVGSLALDDRMRLSHTALVSALTEAQCLSCVIRDRVEPVASPVMSAMPAESGSKFGALAATP